MKKSRYIYLISRMVLLSSFSLFLFSAFVFAQKAKNNQQFLIWQQRVDTLTDDIVKDSSSVPDTERGIYLALLAKIWWKANPDEAKTFLQKSAKITISSLESDDKTDLAAKIKNAQKVIQITASLDERLSQNLLEQFIKITTDKAQGSEQNGDVLVAIALQVVEKNPQLAFEIGIRSLSYGNPLQIVRLIGDLNLKDPKLAEQLFLTALNNAKNNYNLRFIGRLSVRVFANYSGGKPMSDLARRTFLTVLAEMVARASASANGQEAASDCEITLVAVPIIDKFDQYLPAASQTVRRQIQLCQPFISKTNVAGIVESELNPDKPKTVEELISAAQNTDDKSLMGDYYYKAIVKLAESKKFDEILSLLDSMTEREKDLLGIDTLGIGIWEGWYDEYAFESAMQYIKNKDLASVYRIINRTPKKVRPSVRIALASKIPVNEYQGFMIENLEGARKELNSIDISPFWKGSYFLSLVDLYIKVQPFEAASVFREAVKAINSADNDNPNNLPEKDYAALRDYVPLSSKLLETDEISIFNSFADISSRRSRVRLKLGLLESSLQKYLIEKKKIELENKKQPSKNT